jgi:hypothetical protein
MRAHDVVTCGLVYLAVGSIVWMALYGAGLVQEAYAKRRDPKLAILLASIGVIVGWPMVAWVFLAGLIEGARR